MSRSKAKGTAFESEVVNYINRHGGSVMRMPLHGAHDLGDIAGVPDTTIEVKACATLTPSSWLAEVKAESANARTRYGVVIAKRRSRGVHDAYAIMTLDTLIALWQKAGILRPDGAPTPTPDGIPDSVVAAVATLATWIRERA